MKSKVHHVIAVGTVVGALSSAIGAQETTPPQSAPARSAKPAVSQPEKLQIKDAGQAFELSVPVSRLVMIIPKSGLSPEKNPAGGAANHPRYFYFVDPVRGFNVSGWFEPQQNFPGIKKFWESETKEWKSRGLPDPQDVSFMKIDKWDAIVYDMPSGADSSSHARANWLQAGTWIDMHVSTTTKGSSAQLRAKLLALIKQIQVKEKK